MGQQLASVGLSMWSVRFLQVDKVNQRRLRVCVQYFVRSSGECGVLGEEVQ